MNTFDALSDVNLRKATLKARLVMAKIGMSIFPKRFAKKKSSGKSLSHDKIAKSSHFFNFSP